MNSNEEERLRVIAAADKRQEFYTDFDGFCYWWPEAGSGHLSSYHLRWLADELDRRNAEWKKSIDDYFEAKEAEERE